MNVGSASSAILSFAAVPFARKFCIFTTKLGGRCTGSSRPRNVRRGSAPETTAFAENFFAAREANASDRAVLHENLGDFGAGANFGARCFRSGGHRGGERAHAALRNRGAAGRVRIAGGTKQHQERGAGGPRAKRGAENSASGNSGAQQVRFKKFGDEIRGGHWAPTDQAHHFAFAEAANFAADLEELPGVFFRGLFDDRRREEEQLARDAAESLEGFHELGILRRVFLREGFDLLLRGAMRH